LKHKGHYQRNNLFTCIVLIANTCESLINYFPVKKCCATYRWRLLQIHRGQEQRSDIHLHVDGILVQVTRER
ncbi:hypothetical protein ACJX0J_016056, partial [Zea mays]